jgi:hypothetical protein
MPAVMLVVVSPYRDQLEGKAQARERELVVAFVPLTAVGVLDEAVLHEFAGRDVVPFGFPGFIPRAFAAASASFDRREIASRSAELARKKWRAPTEEPGGVLWEMGTDRRRSFGVKRCGWH